MSFCTTDLCRRLFCSNCMSLYRESGIYHDNMNKLDLRELTENSVLFSSQVLENPIFLQYGKDIVKFSLLTGHSRTHFM